MILSRRTPRRVAVALGTVILAIATTSGGDAMASPYKAVNLVSDGGVPALHTDHNLVNAWGVAFGPGPIWIADNGTGKATIYDGRGNALSLVVTIPGGAPTGTVFNGSPGFVVSKGRESGPSLFVFDSEAGVISGWSPTTDASHAIVGFKARDGAIYKGLALAMRGDRPFLFAADFHNAKVDVLNDHFHRVIEPGAFVDPAIPKRYAPFGIQTIGSRVLVTFAKQDADREDEVDGAGLGFVDAFNPEGRLLRRLVSQGRLNAPWGLARAPTKFGPLGGSLLVGNFGDGRINAFNPFTGDFVGVLRANGAPFAVPGLWGLSFGNGQPTQSRTTLFFAAGPADESHGLYGRIDAVAP